MNYRLLAVGVALLVGAGLALALAVSSGEEPRTELTLTATNSFVGRAVFRLRCQPPEGDVPDPSAACAALARNPQLVTNPKPFTCFGGTFSWWELTIAGRLDGDPVAVKTSTCWTPQMALIEALGIGWNELEEHVDPLSRPAYPGSGIPRSALADLVEIPEGTPGWLVRIGRLQARWLLDPRPDRLRIALGRQHRITLWGDFVCINCRRPGGARPPRGRVAQIVVDPATRIVDSFSLTGAPGAKAGPTGSPSYVRGWEACLRAQATDALPPFSQYLRHATVQVAAKRYAERIEQIVRAHINLRRGDSLRLGFKGCVDAVWPDGVAVRAISLRALVRGDRFMFPPRAIRRREIVTCVSGGIRVKARVPGAGRGLLTHGDGTSGSATIEVRTRRDGTVVASCR